MRKALANITYGILGGLLTLLRKPKPPADGSAAHYNERLTVGDHLISLLPRLKSTKAAMPEWPADVFGLSTSLLTRGGAYAAAMDSWPPPDRSSTWAQESRGAGTRWRMGWGSERFAELDEAWKVVLDHWTLPLEIIRSSTDLQRALLELAAASDEACAGVGINNDTGHGVTATPEDDFYDLARALLLESNSLAASLCREMHPSRMKVLPKMHTPQTGLTIRSFSLNLAAVFGDEIRPKWYEVPQFLADSTTVPQRLRLLVVPWPIDVSTGDFAEVTRLPGEMENMPPQFGFFEYQPVAPAAALGHVTDVLSKVESTATAFDGIVLPEMALTTIEYEALYEEVVKKRKKFLLSGVRIPAIPGEHCKNQVRLEVPLFGSLIQEKHHRWQLEAGQITKYSLALDPKRKWWEHISLKSREFMFVSLDKGLVLSVLICEDLARPDPVGDLIRAVGPNLVIALLMDGPQIGGRWPGRYAASLADDPGSSVLCVTSLGMSLRSTPSAGTADDRRRVVALWHHPGAKRQEIELPDGDDALLLTIEKTYAKEWSADGRDDNENAGILHLNKWESFPSRKVVYPTY